MKVKKKHRIKSKFRFILSMTIVLIIVIAISGIITGQNQALSLTKEAYIEITIIKGDTLWDLAKAYGPKNRDVRQIIYAICKINNVSPDKLQPGQKILIPTHI